jgi:methyl-accepting chemotaxis protein
VAISVLYLLAAREIYRKIADPLQRIRTDLHAIGSGDLARRVMLRDADEFKDFAADVNSLAAALHGRFAELRMHSDELAAPAKKLARTVSRAEKDDILRSVRTAVRAIQDQIGAMTV